MLRTISDLIPHDPDLPDRSRTTDILNRILDGTLYESGQFVDRGVVTMSAAVAVTIVAWEN